MPEPASEGELDQARYDVRKAIYELNNDHTRLAALQQARERARAERHAAAEAVAEAEQELVKARTHSRAHPIEAYVDNEVCPSVADCEARLHIETGHLRDAEELDHALRDEIAEIEGNDIKDHDYSRSKAAGSLICRSPEFLSLVARVTTAYQTIRDTRLLVNELARLVLLDSKVTVFALNSQPDKGARYGGYPVDEHLISERTNAVPSC